MSGTSPASPSFPSSHATPACTTAIPGKYGSVPYGACNSYYNHDPAWAPALAFTTLFALATATHVVQAFMFKKRFSWAIVFAGCWFIAAFFTRVLGAHDQQNQALATSAHILILLAPIWINAFVCMILGRMVYFFLPAQHFCGIRAVVLTRCFVVANGALFLVQAAGVGFATSDSAPEIVRDGVKTYMGGIGLQQLLVILLLVFCVQFDTTARQLELSGEARRLRERPWRRLLWTMYAVLALITVRIIYRVSELGLSLSPAKNREVYVYALDAMPMFLALVLLSVTHPGMVLVGPESEFPRLTGGEKKGRTAAGSHARRGPKEEKKEARSFGGELDDTLCLTAALKMRAEV